MPRTFEEFAPQSLSAIYEGITKTDVRSTRSKTFHESISSVSVSTQSRKRSKFRRIFACCRRKLCRSFDVACGCTSAGSVRRRTRQAATLSVLIKWSTFHSSTTIAGMKETTRLHTTNQLSEMKSLVRSLLRPLLSSFSVRHSESRCFSTSCSKRFPKCFSPP